MGRLSDGRVIRRFERGRHVYFQADEACPIYEELRGIVAKTSGATPCASRYRGWQSGSAWPSYGSIARGDENAANDVHLMVVGDVAFAEVAGEVRAAEETLRRRVMPASILAMSSSRSSQAGRFLSRVMAGDKLMLIGDGDDLRAPS